MYILYDMRETDYTERPTDNGQRTYDNRTLTHIVLRNQPEKSTANSTTPQQPIQEPNTTSRVISPRWLELG